MKYSVSTLNWPEAWPYKPEVSVEIEPDGKYLSLLWKVSEQTTKAEQAVLGGPVYEDSCVEIFIQPDPADPRYYNFEFNAAGKVAMACRTGRNDPEDAPLEVLRSIEVAPSLGREPFAEHAAGPWTLGIRIPVTALFKHHFEDWVGHGMKGNIYKCGDGLSTPHFVTWSPVGTEKPDYHRPEFFVPLGF